MLCPLKVKTLALIGPASQTSLGIIQWGIKDIKMRLEFRLDQRQPSSYLRSSADVITCSDSLRQLTDSDDISQSWLLASCDVRVTSQEERVFKVLKSALELRMETSQSLNVHRDVSQLWINNLHRCKPIVKSPHWRTGYIRQLLQNKEYNKNKIK